MRPGGMASRRAAYRLAEYLSIQRLREADITRVG
jgi:hypothetical protein